MKAKVKSPLRSPGKRVMQLRLHKVKVRCFLGTADKPKERAYAAPNIIRNTILKMGQRGILPRLELAHGLRKSCTRQVQDLRSEGENILHIHSHGSRNSGIEVYTEGKKRGVVTKTAFYNAYTGFVDMVVITACYSQELARTFCAKTDVGSVGFRGFLLLVDASFFLRRFYGYLNEHGPRYMAALRSVVDLAVQDDRKKLLEALILFVPVDGKAVEFCMAGPNSLADFLEL